MSSPLYTFHPACIQAALAARKLDEQLRQAVAIPEVAVEHEKYCREVLINTLNDFKLRYGIRCSVEDREWANLASKAFSSSRITVSENFHERVALVHLDDGSFITIKIDLQYKDYQIDHSNNGLAREIIEYNDSDLAFDFGALVKLTPITGWILATAIVDDKTENASSNWPANVDRSALNDQNQNH